MSLRRLARNQFSIIVLALLIFLSVAPVAAQDIIVPPPIDPPPVEPPIDPPPIGVTGPVDVSLHSVDATIDGAVAAVHVTQVFRNTTERTLEATYVFPLPADAAIGDVQMTVDGEVLEGQLYKAEEARRIYEEIVRRQRDPALLEYLGNGLFQTSVFPIPANAERTVELTYRQVLTLEDGLYRFAVPLSSAQNRSPADTLAISVELIDQPGLRTIYSPSHNVSIQRQGNDGALVGFESSGSAEQRDFVLYFGTDESAIGVDLLSYNPASEDGFFLLLAAPAVDTGAQAVVARDLVLVLDVSGSMQGEKMEQAREAARFVVQNLNPGDRFNLIRFSTGTAAWRGELQETTAESQQSALDWIDDLRANGSTDINRALLEALAQVAAESNRPAYVLFLTDGLPTQGERTPERIIANAEQNAPRDRTVRLFTFGVGYDVNTDLLDTVSRNLGGRSHYVRPEEAIDEAVSGFYDSISTPVLADVTIDVEGANVSDTYPYPLPDLFAGQQLVWAGRYQTGGPITVVLRGEVNGEEQVFRYDDLSLAQSGGESAVARIWATRKIGSLLSEVRRSGPDQEIIDAIVDLSLTYGIVTPYTSYLVLEPGMTAGVDGDAAFAQAEALAEDAQPQSMRGYAASAVADEVAAVAEAEESGEAAVAGSIARQELESVEVVREERSVRYVAGKSFTQQGRVPTADGSDVAFWVDTSYEEGMSMRAVTFGSDAYFDLVARGPEWAQWLSLSPEMVLVADGEAIRITSDDEASSSASPLPTPAAEAEDDPGPWQRFRNFWRDLFDR